MEKVETDNGKDKVWRQKHRMDLRFLLDEIARIKTKLDNLQDQLDNSENRLLDVEQVADRLNLSERTVRSLISDGTIPSTKVKRRRLVPSGVLETFIQRKVEESVQG